MAVKVRRKAAASSARPRKVKFQADLVPADHQMVRTLKRELGLSSNTDFLANALALFSWAVSERRLGHRIISEAASGERTVLMFPRLERVAPELGPPRVEIPWTEGELESLAGLLAADEAAPPTPLLIRALRG